MKKGIEEGPTSVKNTKGTRKHWRLVSMGEDSLEVSSSRQGKGKEAEARLSR